jgi:predicted nucleic acid-binding protein
VATYYDSSAVLEVLLDGPHADAVATWWDEDTVRVTSILLEAECTIVLRRAAQRANLALEAPAVRRRLAALDAYLEAMIVRDVDRDVLDVARRTRSLAGCRSLDAMHLATALLFGQHAEEPLRICVLDQRLRRLASAHGFSIVPAR